VVLDVALVGTGGMMPLPGRWLSSVLVRYRGRLLLFDCGEGTQISLRALGWGLKAIDLVLISHLHGDHLAGLPGLLLTLGNSGRTEPVQVLGPAGLGEAVKSLRVIAPYLPFEVCCRDLQPGETFEFGDLHGTCAEADHHVPCLAYRLDLPREPAFLPERARALGVPVREWRRLQSGEPVECQGRRIAPGEVLGPPRKGLSLGLVTDTRPTPRLEELVGHVDLLICEGMYGSDEDLARAEERKHMTFREAATLARQAEVGQLVLTHFSPSLSDPKAYESEARAIFPEARVGEDHLSLELKFP
jgi:ribonuclease Z